MRRTGDADSYLRLVERIRVYMPDVALRTTVISGFPGETRSDARLLEEFLQDAEFEYVGVFVFSPEGGTPAATMPDQVSPRTARARAQRIRDLADAIGFRKVDALVGKALDVLVERPGDDASVVEGRWRGQAPEIDGLVLLDCGTPGEIVRARVVDALGYDVEAEVVE
jgi:ribosomal protein S12 methylthiotransferase